MLAGGAAYVLSELDGEHADYTAPESQPMLTTRGRLSDAESDTQTVATEGEWSFADADELVLFVHGFDTGPQAARDQTYTLDVGLAEYRSSPVAGYSWESDGEWADAKDVADANAEPLADWLGQWATDDGRPVHLIGYSLGARVVCAAIDELQASGTATSLASVSLLGGAIPSDSVERDGTYGDAIAALDAPVTNFYSGRDRVLGWVYRLSDRTTAVGSVGVDDPAAAPDGYADVDVTDIVADHYSYFEPEEGCLSRVADSLD
ncbi:alpha/beta fold hydrolase [Halonotius terrestris]|uniref:alpha/beta fold hydrolase n=1 Tax=Halonotius terrestris TaxID=2487750 RepID=UPI0031F30899